MEVSNNRKALTIIQYIGSGLTIISILYIIKSFWSQKTTILSNISLEQIFVAAFLGGLIYFAGNFLLAIAWSSLLKWSGEIITATDTNIGIYGRSQILKYIPGNLFSLPSRYVLSYQTGIGHGNLISATILEIMGLLAASSLVSILGIITTKNNLKIVLLTASVVLLVTIASPLIIQTLFRRFNYFKKTAFFQTIIEKEYLKLLTIWCFYVFFFIITGIILWLIVLSVNGDSNTISILAIFYIYAISWFTGFITPGAPAGAGIREGLMILLLTNHIGAANSITVSILFRVTTTIGDVAFYFISLFLKPQNKIVENNTSQ